MVTSPYEWKILEWNENPKQKKNDLGLSRLEFEHPTFRGENSKPLRNHRCCSEEKRFLLNVSAAEVADHFQIWRKKRSHGFNKVTIAELLNEYADMQFHTYGII